MFARRATAATPGIRAFPNQTAYLQITFSDLQFSPLRGTIRAFRLVYSRLKLLPYFLRRNPNDEHHP